MSSLPFLRQCWWAAVLLLAGCAQQSDQDYQRHHSILLREFAMSKQQYENKEMDAKQYRTHLERLWNREKLLFYEAERRKFTDPAVAEYFQKNNAKRESPIHKEMLGLPSGR